MYNDVEYELQKLLQKLFALPCFKATVGRINDHDILTHGLLCAQERGRSQGIRRQSG